MKSRILPLIVTMLLVVSSVTAQVCGTYEGSLEKDIQKYPSFYQSLENLNKDLEERNRAALTNMAKLKTEHGKKIIPVVVHIIHDGGGENLSVAEIQNGLDHLNKNINGQADNFLSGTPDIFAAVRGNLNVEFRLAKKDPKGEPTTGIVRVRSELTIATVTETLSRNRVKALSYWPSYKYFNIWVVASMPAGPDPSEDPALNGYAQFPETGRMSTDGVMIRAGVFRVGETITHEVGHWLGLCHTWACGAGTCGTDNIADTPQDSAGIFDFNGFPFNVDACTAPTGPAGEMYVNYMDYQSDNVQTMFTKGQDEAMNETLEGVYDAESDTTGIGYREYMWSQENIDSTGVADGYLNPTCTQQADFAITNPKGVSSICVGSTIVLRGNQTQFGTGNVTSMLWEFGDGQTSNSTAAQIQHTYTSESDYTVSLTIEYNETTESRASNLSDLDLSIASSYDSIVKTIIVQGTEAELLSMGATNIAIHLDLDGYSVNSYTDTNGIYYPDTLFYRGELEEKTYVAYYSNSCTSKTDKVNFIKVGPATSSSNSSSYSYSFEEADALSADWRTTNDVVDAKWSFNLPQTATSWQVIDGVAVNGSSSIMIDRNNLDGNTELISKAYNLSGLSNPAIKFSYSGAASNDNPVNELNILYSYNCGEDWLPLATLNKYRVANAGLYSSNFEPQAYEWEDTLIADLALKNNNIRFKFEYVVNGSANNFYIDNIQIGQASSLFSPSINNARLSIYPNPSKGNAIVKIDNLAEKNIEVELVNVLGTLVKRLFDGEIISNEYELPIVDLSDLETGVYFVKVVSEGDVVTTQKLILSK